MSTSALYAPTALPNPSAASSRRELRPHRPDRLYTSAPDDAAHDMERQQHDEKFEHVGSAAGASLRTTRRRRA